MRRNKVLSIDSNVWLFISWLIVIPLKTVMHTFEAQTTQTNPATLTMRLIFQIMSQIGISSGISTSDFDKLRTVCDMIPELEYICLDVANGYSEVFVDFIRRVREQFPTHTIFAGNVVTGEMVEELILSGADVVKVSYFLEVLLKWLWVKSVQIVIGIDSTWVLKIRLAGGNNEWPVASFNFFRKQVTVLQISLCSSTSFPPTWLFSK